MVGSFGRFFFLVDGFFLNKIGFVEVIIICIFGDWSWKNVFILLFFIKVWGKFVGFLMGVSFFISLLFLFRFRGFFNEFVVLVFWDICLLIIWNLLNGLLFLLKEVWIVVVDKFFLWRGLGVFLLSNFLFRFGFSFEFLFILVLLLFFFLI